MIHGVSPHDPCLPPHPKGIAQMLPRVAFGIPHTVSAPSICGIYSVQALCAPCTTIAPWSSSRRARSPSSPTLASSSPRPCVEGARPLCRRGHCIAGSAIMPAGACTRDFGLVPHGLRAPGSSGQHCHRLESWSEKAGSGRESSLSEPRFCPDIFVSGQMIFQRKYLPARRWSRQIVF